MNRNRAVSVGLGGGTVQRDRGIPLPLCFRKLKEAISRSGKSQEKLLPQILDKLTISRASYFEFSRRGEIRGYSESIIDQVLEIIDAEGGRVMARAADPRKHRLSLLADQSETTCLPSGSAERGEIEIVKQSSENLIDPERYPKVAPYVAVYVDEVKFFQRDKLTGERRVAPGQYITIDVPSGQGGAVGLPVCLETQEVMLVAQFRHPQRKFMVELPRGFANLHLDDGPSDTAKRETREETGLVVEDRRQICLRSLYTDSGKLAERPTYYLQFVDRQAFQSEFLTRSSVMQAPAWVPINDFYESIFSEEPVLLNNELFDEQFLRANRAWLDGLSDLDVGRLHIEDAFTVTAGLLAIPHLIPKLPALPCWTRLRHPG